MKYLKLEENKNIENSIIKDVRNSFRSKKLRKEENCTAIKDIRNLFRLKKENKAIKKKKKKLKTEQFQILGIFLSMKKKKTIMNL